MVRLVGNVFNLAGLGTAAELTGMVGPFCWAANCLAMAMAAGGNRPDIMRFDGGKLAIVGVGKSEGRVTLLAKEVNLTGGLSAGG